FNLKNLILVAGGTGGHILPAIAFGDWIRREKPDIRVDYVSGSRPVELEIYRASSIEPFVLDTSGSPLGISGIRSLLRWVELLHGFLQTDRLMKRIKPDLCIMFGGYVSLPALLSGRLRGIRSTLHEQNAVAGRVTRIAARFGIPIASGWKKCEPLSPEKHIPVGVPFRHFEQISTEDAKQKLGIDEEDIKGPIVSVMTGSLGSENLLEVLTALSVRESLSSWHFYVLDPEVEEPVKIGHGVTRIPQIWDISPFYAVSDLLLTRGGASTLAEVVALDKPVVVAPWRGAKDDHQMKNVLCLSETKKISIWDERNDTLMDLEEKLLSLYTNFIRKNGDSVNLLYNAGEASEASCRRLWDYVIGLFEGEN
ncbi:MAG: UDP-N-acetylglucosamine--N-acetylmuramyl-(pentapeptide) pyrophosphoryl-undecaprenol N-acetylglucosamine transferase, partial [Synergistaceae bacterium]|nr:UDP-N-acetylglucosamine--N-acetylmuramyl-(pentapeptide) pyrophosphoryl-undecaprenol N-acetylglucosamine transferase [Synergistaceae bacterium]